MPIALVFFVHYAYLILFTWVLLEQLGIPIPSIPVLLSAGTLSAAHRISDFYALLVVLLACAHRRQRMVLPRPPLRWQRHSPALPPLLRDHHLRHPHRGLLQPSRPRHLALRQVRPRTLHRSSAHRRRDRHVLPPLPRLRPRRHHPLGEAYLLAGRFFGDLAQRLAPRSSPGSATSPSSSSLPWCSSSSATASISSASSSRRSEPCASTPPSSRKCSTPPPSTTPPRPSSSTSATPSTTSPTRASSWSPAHRTQRTHHPQRAHPPRPRRHPLLHLPQRGDQRQGSHAAPQARRLSRPPPPRRLRWLERCRLPPRRLRRGRTHLPSRRKPHIHHYHYYYRCHYYDYTHIHASPPRLTRQDNYQPRPKPKPSLKLPSF